MRIVLGGSAAALALGLMLGAAMQPNLAGDDRPAGPQTILGAGAARVASSEMSPTLASYPGGLPDYLLGTDAKAPALPPEDLRATAPEARTDLAARDETPAAPALTRASYDDPAPTHGPYPSTGGELPKRAPVGQAVDDSDVEPVVSG